MNTMLLTVFGAVVGSSSIWISPHEVCNVHRYFFFVSIVMAGGFEYLPLNRATVDAAAGVVPPQATAAGVAVGVGVELGVGVALAWGFPLPPSTSAATAPPAPSTSASTTESAMIRFRRCLRRSAWRLAASLAS